MDSNTSTTIVFAQTIVIIGGGFSGSMVAAHLLQTANGSLSLKLIECRQEVGRGVAYSTPLDLHLLNVPAGKMSAFAERPEHFLHWLQSVKQQRKDIPTLSNVNASTFVPRRVYGDYIESILKEASANPARGVCFEQIAAEALKIEPSGNGALVYLNTGNSVYADRIVLALGNFSASLPAAFSHLKNSERYVKEAWSGEATATLNPEAPVLLVGTGLTMVDMAVSLYQQGHKGSIYSVSRHGLLPQRHRLSSAYPTFIDVDDAPQTLRELLHRVRQEIQEAASKGQDWRAVLDSLRPSAQQLWQRLPLPEQQRFLRHVKSYWEVHRHRLAPEIANVLDELWQSGQLVPYAGRIQTCREFDNGVEVELRQRGTGTPINLQVKRIINCTGSSCDYRRLQHPLITSLQDQRLIRSSALALGIETAVNGAVMNADGKASNWLYTLGTARQGSLWETTAVPELRVQAKELARELLQSLPHEVTAVMEPQLRVEQSPLIFQQLFDRESCTYTYLIAEAKLGMAALVDPVLEQVERDLQILRELGLTLRYCLETHVHADHVTGSGKLRTLTECQIVVPHEAPVRGADRFIADSEVLQLGIVAIEALVTPGHTNSHMAYLVNGTHVLTGDALFIRGCGRTDFQGGDAGFLYDAVTQKLFALADDTLVYPGHDYQGRTVSSIGEEKRWNPRFTGRDRAQFETLMANLNLPYPKKMKQAVRANECCGDVLEPDFQAEALDIHSIGALDSFIYGGMYI